MTARSRPAPRRAFTLVEMLVAMVLTLILVAAIAEFYAYVGETVKDGRAMIEMSGSLRTAVQRLRTDLDLLTLPVAPWTDDGGGVLVPRVVVNNITIFPDTVTPIGSGAGGYFEIFEGPASDCDVNANNIIDLSDLTADIDGDGMPDWNEPNVTSLLGDGDDFIAMTIRASGQPLTGRYGTYPNATATVAAYSIVLAQHAEVIWWVGFDDLNANGVWNLEEPRQIYRRQLLIRPDAGLNGLLGPPPREYQNFADAQRVLKEFWQTDDISASIRLESNAMGNPVYRLRPNSLADLSRRERRFAHTAFAANGTDNFPYPQALLPSYSAASPGVSTFGPKPSYVQQGAGRGEDIVLTNLLAMDVQVYDQGALLRADTSQATLATDAISGLSPSDPGYVTAIQQGFPVVGTGAYVDLGYVTKLEGLLGVAQGFYYNNPTRFNTAFGNSLFGAAPNYYLAQGSSYPGLGLVYDTWSLSYERDGLNQDWLADNGNMSNINQAPFDEGTNGLDDDGINGVDDVGERETQPPFSRPLRGIQITIRVYEPGTRQMRQATVKADFINE